MTNRTGNTARLPRNPNARATAPRVVLGVGVAGGPGLAEMFHDRGWEVLPAVSAADARRLAVRARAAVAVLAADGDADGESGVLSCAKLMRGNPRLRVVLVGPDDAVAERYARFAGAAAYVSDDAPAEAILAAVRAF